MPEPGQLSPDVLERLDRQNVLGPAGERSRTPARYDGFAWFVFFWPGSGVSTRWEPFIAPLALRLLYCALGRLKMATLHTKVGLLNSWKEIATYLGRGVRTAQRWERYGLPVRRLAPGPRASVIADAHDIDTWIRSAKSHGFGTEETCEPLLFHEASLATVKQSRSFRSEHELLEDGKKRLEQLIANVARLKANCERASQLARSLRSVLRSNSPNQLFARAPQTGAEVR